MAFSGVLQTGGGLDYEVLAAMAVTAFFAVLAILLLARYRRVSRQAGGSDDLVKGLWEALDGRLKAQDERILDVMTRMEVIQERTIAGARQGYATLGPQQPYSTQSQLPTLREEPRPQPQAQPQQPPYPYPYQYQPQPAQPERPRPATTRIRKPGGPDSAEMKALRFLSEGPKTSVEVKDLTTLSREHAARVMKDLFNRGLVVRDDSHKPFVYQITEAGKNYLSSG